MANTKYVAAISMVVAMAALFLTIHVITRPKQSNAKSIPAMLRAEVREEVRAEVRAEVEGVLRQKDKKKRRKITDVGASAVFSSYSKLDSGLKGLGLPDVVELDYVPVEIRDGMSQIDHEDALVSLAVQRQVVCQNWEMYGLKTDGGWPVCKAAALIPKQPCTVYSFGIKNDWSFDDAYRKAHGCTIRTFDPSMGDTKEHEHSPGVFFYPVGLSNKKEKHNAWNLESYRGLLKRFNEEKNIIPYLKFDVETFEWRVLENMQADGVLKNVMQLSFEIHVDNLANAKAYFHTLKKLEALGFRRWFYHHRLNGYSFQCDQSYVNINFLHGKV